MMNWKILSTEYISRHPYFTARKDVCEKPDGTNIPAYFVVELPAAATALALTEDGHAVMVKQYRHPLQEVMLETPGGFIDEDEDYEEGMRRELMEETGYDFSHIEHLGKVAANPGVLNNYTHLFLATGGKKVAAQKLDAQEDIDIALMPLDELITHLEQNHIKQSLHVNCIYFALMKMGKLKWDL
jgi:ADP-ribose pyrophosphatase